MVASEDKRNQPDLSPGPSACPLPYSHPEDAPGLVCRRSLPLLSSHRVANVGSDSLTGQEERRGGLSGWCRGTTARLLRPQWWLTASPPAPPARVGVLERDVSWSELLELVPWGNRRGRPKSWPGVSHTAGHRERLTSARPADRRGTTSLPTSRGRRSAA